MGRPPSYDHTMLLREIIDCLWERGYAATPISVIVQETGVNAASLYARFGRREMAVPLPERRPPSASSTVEVTA